MLQKSLLLALSLAASLQTRAEGLIKPIKLTTKGVARRTLGNAASEKR